MKKLMSPRPLSTGDSAKSEPSDTRWAIVTVATLFGVTTIVGSVLWTTGLFNFSGTDAMAKVLVAVLTLVGTLFGTTVSLIGLMLKRSLDTRNWVLQAEAEARLNLDTAIKAVELFKSASGSASPSESAGALFALTRLGQLQFALALLEELWAKDLIQSPSAVWVINSCLRSKDVDAPERAANLLLANAAKLPNGRGSMHWPEDYSYEWPSDMSFLTRYALLHARIEALLSKPFDYWKDNVLNVDIVALANGFHADSSPVIRQSAAAFLAILLRIHDPSYIMFLPTGEFAIEKVRAEVEKIYGRSFSGSSDRDQELEKELKAWIKPTRQAPRSADKMQRTHAKSQE